MDRMEIFSFHLRCRSSDSSILSSVDIVVERTEEAVRTKRPATRYLALIPFVFIDYLFNSG